METLRFLMVTTFYPPYHLGGDAVHVRYLAEALALQGHEVHVEFAPAAYRLKRGGGPPLARDPHPGVRLHPIPSPLGRAQPMAAYLAGRARSVTRFHRRLVRELRPDVIHHHNISLLGRGVLDEVRGARTLYTAHDYWLRCARSDLFKYGQRPCERATCTRCALRTLRPPQLWRTGPLAPLPSLDMAIAPSRFMLAAIRGALACPLVHIPNFAPDPNPGGRTWAPEDYYLYVGTHEHLKGVTHLARAAVRWDGPALIFVGLGPEARRLQGLRWAGANIELRGWIEGERLGRLYRQARGLIVPSLSHDNAPLAAIEALSWGTPLLVARRGGLEELIQGEAAGRSFEPEVPAIRDALDTFEASGLPDRLRQGARRAYEKHHRPETYLDLYGAVVRGEVEPTPRTVAPPAAKDLPASGPAPEGDAP